jgi:hypothetical protein
MAASGPAAGDSAAGDPAAGGAAAGDMAAGGAAANDAIASDVAAVKKTAYTATSVIRRFALSPVFIRFTFASPPLLFRQVNFGRLLTSAAPVRCVASTARSSG